jgi:acetyl esterase/lipase
MLSISPRNRFVSFSAALLLAAPLSASAGLLDSLSSWRDGSSTTSTGTTSTTGTTTTSSTSYTTRTVTYTPSNWSQALKGDLFLPANNGSNRPVVILLHGGAWQRGDKSSMTGTGQTLAKRGYAAFAINYRFAPGSTHPSQLQDMQQALRYLQAHAAEYKLDLNRLGAWGYSAGGHLASLLAVQPMSDLPTVKVTIAGAPPSDLSAPEARDASSVKIYMGSSYSQIPALYDQASPRRQVRTGMSPVFLYHGTIDTVVPPVQSENFVKTLQAANVPVQIVWLTGKDHSTASGATTLYRDKAFAFLDKYISGSAVTTTPTTTTPTVTDTTPTTPTTTTGTTPTTTTPTTTTSTSTYDRLRSFLGN